MQASLALKSTVQEQVNFEDLVRSQRDRLIGVAYHLLAGDHEAAQDAAQEALLKAHRSWRSFRGDAKPETWLMRILINTCHNQRRKQWLGRLLAPAADPAQSGVPETPEHTSERAQLRRRIARAVEGLSRGQREAFVLVHMHELTIEETAQVLHKAPGTIKSHVHRALRQLRETLREETV